MTARRLAAAILSTLIAAGFAVPGQRKPSVELIPPSATTRAQPLSERHAAAEDRDSRVATSLAPARPAEAKGSRRSVRLLPPSTRPSRPVITGSVWDRLAKCESGGNWAINTGNGYFGGLQMDMSFWWSYSQKWQSPDGRWHLVVDRPDHATKAQQIGAAEQARDSGRGYSPWPQCSRKLGLR